MSKLTSKIIAKLNAKKLSGDYLSLYCWLYGKKIVGRKVTIYYRDFARWYRKTTKEQEGEISDRHASRCFLELEKRGFAEVQSRGFGRYEIILFDYLVVLGQECHSTPKMADSPNPRNVDESYCKDQKSTTQMGKQQQLITIGKMLASVNVKFQSLDLAKIARYGIEAVSQTIKLYNVRSLTSEISNPEGWVRKCLERGWYKDMRPLVPKTAIEQYLRLKEYLLDNLGTLPT